MTLLLTVLTVSSFFGGLDPAWIAFLGAAFGGAGLKLIEHWLGKNRVKVSDAQQIRDELRQTVTDQKAEIAELEESRDKWQREYYDLRDKMLDLQMKVLDKHINKDL